MVAIQALKSIWVDGELVPWEQAQVHILTHGLHYGYAVFEGIRSHATASGTAIFRLRDHIERFLNSAKIYRMKIPYSQEQLERACCDVVRDNGVADVYIRPIAFSGYGEMGLDPTTTRPRPPGARSRWLWPCGRGVPI